MSKKLTLDKSTLSRLQSEQLSAITGGETDYDSTAVDVDAQQKTVGGTELQVAAAGDSCCSKSCNRN